MINDASSNGLILALGRGGSIVTSRFGRALEMIEPAPLKIFAAVGGPEFGLTTLQPLPGRKLPPMSWLNAHFAALITSGERHIRSPGFTNATGTKLNLGNFDWTVEFWFQSARPGDSDGVTVEIGEGPRGENDRVTRLTLKADRSAFTLDNQPGGTKLAIPSSPSALSPGWHHLAFVYSASERQLSHYVDGVLQPLPAKAALKPLAHGDDACFSIGRDGLWQRPLAVRLDELRFSDLKVYTSAFQPPGSFSVTYGKGIPPVTLNAGPPLLFGANDDKSRPVELGSRKHVFNVFTSMVISLTRRWSGCGAAWMFPRWPAEPFNSNSAGGAQSSTPGSL